MICVSISAVLPVCLSGHLPENWKHARGRLEQVLRGGGAAGQAMWASCSSSRCGAGPAPQARGDVTKSTYDEKVDSLSSFSISFAVEFFEVVTLFIFLSVVYPFNKNKPGSFDMIAL